MPVRRVDPDVDGLVVVHVIPDPAPPRMPGSRPRPPGDGVDPAAHAEAAPRAGSWARSPAPAAAPPACGRPGSPAAPTAATRARCRGRTAWCAHRIPAPPVVHGGRIEVLRAGQLVQRRDDADVGRVGLVAPPSNVGQFPHVPGADVARAGLPSSAPRTADPRGGPARPALSPEVRGRTWPSLPRRKTTTVVDATIAAGTSLHSARQGPAHRGAPRPVPAGPCAAVAPGHRRPRRRPGPPPTGPAPVTLPSSQPSGAATAALATIRRPKRRNLAGRWLARATASAAPRPAAPASAPTAAAARPRCAASVAPATAPISPANPTCCNRSFATKRTTVSRDKAGRKPG